MTEHTLEHGSISSAQHQNADASPDIASDIPYRAQKGHGGPLVKAKKIVKNNNIYSGLSPEKIAMGSCVVFILIITAIVFTFSLPEEDAKIELATVMGETLASRNLLFEDGDNGLVVIKDADTGITIEELHFGEGGFVRQVMRGFVRDRRRNGLGPDVPFQLSVTQNGIIAIYDPAMDRRLVLNAYGKDSAAAFAHLITLKTRPPISGER